MIPLALNIAIIIISYIFYLISAVSLYHLTVSDNISLRRYIDDENLRHPEKFREDLKNTILLIRSASFAALLFFLITAGFLLVLSLRFLSPSSVFTYIYIFAFFYVFGQFVPELLTAIRNKTFVTFSLKFSIRMKVLLSPVLFPSVFVAKILWKGDQVIEETNDNERSEHARAYIEDGKEKGFFLSDEEELLHSIVEFSDTIVKEVMTPRVDMLYVQQEMPVADMIKYIQEHNHSRYPVYDENIDDIIGIINIKELFVHWGKTKKNLKIKDLPVQDPYFIPETKMVDDLMREMQQKQIQMCVVVDEYGGTAGLVTLEDLVEEIVGEIQDEYEEPETDITDNDDGSFSMSGKTDIDELEDLTKMELDDEAYETVGGMIFSELGRVPREKEKIEIKGLQIEVLKVDGRKIEKVKVTKSDE